MRVIDSGTNWLSDPEHRAHLRRAVIASTVGTTISLYTPS
jgi:hypothetical protein